HGCFPLPDVGEDFPAYSTLGGLPVGQQTGRGRDDGDAQATEDLGQCGRLGVDPQTRLGYATHTGDAALPVRAVLQVDGELVERAAAALDVADVPAGDVALLLEDLGDVHLQPRVRQHHLVVVRRVGVTQPRQEVRDRVCHCHCFDFFLAVVPLRAFGDLRI